MLLASDSATSAGLAVAGYSAIKQTSAGVALWVIQEGLDAETISSLRKFWSDAAEVNFLTMKYLPWYWATEKLYRCSPGHASRRVNYCRPAFRAASISIPIL